MKNPISRRAQLYKELEFWVKQKEHSEREIKRVNEELKKVI